MAWTANSNDVIWKCESCSGKGSRNPGEIADGRN